MSRLFKALKSPDCLYRLSVIALLTAIVFFQWQQMNAMRSLRYITAEIANNQIAVTNAPGEKLQIEGEVVIKGGEVLIKRDPHAFGEEPLPVKVMNTDSIPVSPR